MEHWQFLIQKQGDRSWRSLTSPNLEVEEGIYRVVARSIDRANTDVEVRVTYVPIEEPPLRRIQKRSRRTNSEGLMAVIPYTHLQPGIWELQCSGDLMSDLFGKSWYESVNLQVLPTGAVREGGAFALSTQAILPPARPVLIDEPVSPVWVKAQTAEQILKNLVDIVLPSSESLLDETTEEVPTDDKLLHVNALPLRLTLDEETYIARWGKTLTVNGRVEHLSEILDDARVCALELRIELRSPWGAQILTSQRQPLPEKVLPFPITCTIEIPACESKLILADISLYGTLTSTGDVTQNLNSELLASQSFTITAEVAELLAISATIKNSEIKTLDYQTEAIALVKAPPSSSLDLQLLNLIKTKKTNPSLLLRSSPKKSLPPLIAPKRNQSGEPRPLELPKLPPQKTKTISAATVVLAIEQNNNEATATLGYSKQQKVLTGDTQFVQSSTPSIFEDYFDSTVDDASNQNAHELVVYNQQFFDDSSTQKVAPSSETNNEMIVAGDPSFSTLIRKWVHSQGYALSEPINSPYEYYDEQDTETPGHGDKESQEIVKVPHLPISPPAPPTPPPPPSWLAQEVVVEDEPSQAEVEQKPISKSKKATLDTLDAVITESLPIPHLHLPHSELISGKSFKVRIQLPELSSKVAVKLWVEDCQTRWLLDGPRMLTLLPNQSSGSEAITYINVPFGCLEIRLEAITVDMATQQESHKVTIVRTVVPENLPIFPLDELLSI